MARSLDTVWFYFGRLGWAGAVGVTLIVGSLAYDASVLKSREAALETQLIRNERARLAADLSAEATAAAETGVAGQPILAPAAAAALRRLFDAASRAGLELAQGEYRLTEVKDAQLRRYQVSLPVAGGYPEIRAFVARALNADPALALTAIQLRREGIESTDLEAQLNFTLYLESGA